MREHGATLFRSLAGTLVPGVRDTQGGFKLMRGDLARELFAELRTDGFSFDVELLARALARGNSIAEFPVTGPACPARPLCRPGTGPLRSGNRPDRAAHTPPARPAALPVAAAPLPIYPLSMPMPGLASAEPASLPMLPPLGADA